MTTKNFKTICFVAMFAAILVPSTVSQAAYGFDNPNFEGATQEEIDEYNLVAPLLKEQYELDIQGRELYNSKNGNLNSEEIKMMNQIHDRIKEIQVTVGKITQDNKELYAMDRETENHFEEQKRSLAKSGLEFSYLSVDTKNALLKVVVPEKNAESESEIRNHIEKTITVPYKLMFGDFSDASCITQESNCDPIIGGIEINDNCSTALPAIRNVFWWTEDGFLTAAHCTSWNAAVYQPNNSFAQDGTTTATVNGGLCDCAFVDETGSAGLDSAVW